MPEASISDGMRDVFQCELQRPPQVIKCLLKTNSFDIDIRDYNEKTPLHYAALNGADEVKAAA